MDHPTHRDVQDRVLVIDANASARDHIEDELRRGGLAVKTALGSRDGLELARGFAPRVIIVDLGAPHPSGIEICRQLRTDPATEEIPLLLVVDRDCAADTVQRALAAGAKDFIERPVSPPILRARVAAHIAAVDTMNQLRALVVTDELTGVFSRRHLLETAQRRIMEATRARPAYLSCLVIDVDHFKRINDQRGHLIGDRVLRHVAQIIANTVRGTDLVARFGGEEFVVLLPHTTPEGASGVGEKVRRAVANSTGEGIRPTISVGVAWYRSPQRRRDLSELDVESELNGLFRRGDEALYRAKEQGRNQVCSQDGVRAINFEI